MAPNIEPEPMRRCYRSTQRSIGECFLNLSAFSSGGAKEKEFDDALFYMIAKDLQPFSIVGDVRFKYFAKTLCPLYALPSVTTITRIFVDKYFVIVNGMKKILSNQHHNGWVDRETHINELFGRHMPYFDK